MPSVSLDNVRDKDKRKLLIDFIYKTTSQAAREVWGDFKVQCVYLSKKHIEELEKPVYYSTTIYYKFLNLIAIKHRHNLLIVY